MLSAYCNDLIGFFVRSACLTAYVLTDSSYACLLLSFTSFFISLSAFSLVCSPFVSFFSSHPLSHQICCLDHLFFLVDLFVSLLLISVLWLSPFVLLSLSYSKVTVISTSRGLPLAFFPLPFFVFPLFVFRTSSSPPFVGFFLVFSSFTSTTFFFIVFPPPFCSFDCVFLIVVIRGFRKSFFPSYFSIV
jgi:hypothetical protein